MTRTGLHQWLMHRWYGPTPIRPLIPFSWLFILLSAMRRACYRYGLLKIVHLPVPVIVIGNITLGGTGKTPLVIWLSQALRDRGYRPGIITRGYRGKSRRWPLPVTATSAATLAGDEAVLLARTTGVPVVAGPDRVRAARQLLHDQSVNVILSDDGLQHYGLGRGLQLLTLDGERGCGNGWQLPAGPLRESAAAIKRADVVVCKSRLPAGMNLPPDTPVMHMQLTEVVRLRDGLRVPLANFRGRSVHSIAGIGHPGQFFALLEAAGLQVEPHPVPDHAVLTRRDLLFGDQRPVLMTEKDAVRCEGLDLPDHWYVPAHARFSRAQGAALLRTVEECLAGRDAAG